MSVAVSGKKKLRNVSQITGAGRGVPRKKTASSSVSSAYKGSAEESAGPKEQVKPSTVSSVYKCSAEYIEYSCDLCSRDGDHVEAEGYCTVCNDYLCSSCIRSHTRNKASQHHALLDKHKMPGNSVITCDSCSRAGENEEAVGFCSDCKEYLCALCFRNHPKNKASRHHALLDKDSMPVMNTRSLSTLNIAAESGTAVQQYQEFTYIRDISIKSVHDENDCSIRGIAVVSETELALIDFDNNSLKLVDMETNVVKGYMTFQTPPMGLKTLPNNQLAIALPRERMIQFVSTSGGVLSAVRTLQVNGVCLAVDYCNGKLYVSFWEPVTFQILRLTDTGHRTIQPDSKVLEHCTRPQYIAVSPDERSIYISDWETNNVLCMDMNGNMITRYEHQLDRPSGIIFSPPCSLYLCNREQHVVYKIPTDLSEATVILRPGDGLQFPRAICFTVGKKRLYISSGSDVAKFRNFIKVYQLK